jgi:hypothetical protein
MATVALALVALRAVGQEMVPTPAPAAKAAPNAGADAIDHSASTPAANATAQKDANRWRYRWSNGRWWYWTPQNRWMWYSDDGRWIEYNPSPSPPPVEPADEPAPYNYSYGPSYGYYGYGPYYPRYGYWYGRYPGVGVGVWPYGDVDVRVGRRVGVDVWGPYGGVRVGRIYVGW